MRVLRWMGWSALLVALLITTAALWYRQTSQPLHEGKVALPGLAGSITVRRDEQGIPTCRRELNVDAAFAWALCTRRTGSGRWSSTGASPPAGLRRCSDHRHRRRRPASCARSASVAPRRAHLRVLRCRASGPGRCLCRRHQRLPGHAQRAAATGVLLTRAPAPEPWTAADSVGWSLMMAWDLARYSMPWNCGACDSRSGSRLPRWMTSIRRSPARRRRRPRTMSSCIA